MVQAVSTSGQKQAFAAAIAGRPYFQALLGRDLALWADNPGAPTRKGEIEAMIPVIQQFYPEDKIEFRLSALVSIPQDIDHPTIASKSRSKIAPLKDLRLKR